MRLSAITAATLIATAFCLALPRAEAQEFPKHLKNCKKQPTFERVEANYTVPDINGGTGIVHLVSQNYTCEHKSKPWTEWPKFLGLKDASGNLIIPYKYTSLMPYSTTGALVMAGDKYRTYTAGKGESKEQFAFQQAQYVTPPSQCRTRSDSGVSVPLGMSRVGPESAVGKANVTLFSPSGQPRLLTAMGGQGLEPAVERIGDVFRARWRDEAGAARTGLLDLSGRQISPVLGATHVWSTMLPPGVDGRTTPNCSGELSFDLLLEGPSLDRDPAKVVYGPLLTLVARDGSPTPLPKGAAGLIPANRAGANPHRKEQKNTTTMWAVVFPMEAGLEFTLHAGPPGEALASASSSARFSELFWTDNGWLMAKAVADGQWRLYRRLTDIPVGEPNSELKAALASGDALIRAENKASEAAAAAAWAAKETERQAALKRSYEAARATGMICQYTLDSTYTQAHFEEYLNVCGPDNFPGFRELAAAKGISQQWMSEAAAALQQRRTEAALARVKWEEEARIERMRNANKNPGASYYPGQWESAIRNAGNVATDAINKSSDNWLQQRQDQYIADWQRSQRAY